MLGHHYVADDIELIAATSLLERVFKDALGARCVEERLTAITTEGYEV